MIFLGYKRKIMLCWTERVSLFLIACGMFDNHESTKLESGSSNRIGKFVGSNN